VGGLNKLGSIQVEVELAILLVFLVFLGAARCYLACRENRLLAHLHRRLQEMNHEEEIKNVELAKAREDLEQAKL
jgi:hypothetical protein